MAMNKQNSTLPLVCLICGDVACGINFKVRSCGSCKIFFRRHKQKPQNQRRQCRKENNCEITPYTRSHCSACRLKKCFACGMNPEIIGSHGHRIQKKQQPCTLNLLQNDRSTLSRQDWDLLSNILHAHDAIDIFSKTKQLLESHSMLPLKVRAKPTVILTLHQQFFASFLPFLQRTKFFHELSPEACEELTQNNIKIFGMFHGDFIIRAVNGMDYPVFRSSLRALYAGDIEQICQSFTLRLDLDSSLIKLLLMILAFSTNCGIVSFDSSKIYSITGNSLSIIKVQNIITSVCWKYLLYKYGLAVAVKKFNCHIKYIMDLLQGSYEQEKLQSIQTVYKMIDDTKQTQIITN